ncbi:MAG: PAS domain S-box protein [Flavobacteriaceae bacterium]|nr:PAS domain S-box protein [Flavobacteriaceae bacterium]
MFLNDQDFYSAFFNSLEEGICIVDNQETILANNSILEEIFGYNKDELTHQSFNILIAGKYKAIHKEQLHNYFISPTANRSGGAFCIQRND